MTEFWKSQISKLDCKAVKLKRNYDSDCSIAALVVIAYNKITIYVDCLCQRRRVIRKIGLLYCWLGCTFKFYTANFHELHYFIVFY